MGKEIETITEIAKFNPYHDSLGRFSSGHGAASMTIRTKDPKKQHWADMAIARAQDKDKKEKELAAAAAAAKPKTTKPTGPKGLGNQKTAGHNPFETHMADDPDGIEATAEELGVTFTKAKQLNASVKYFSGVTGYTAIRDAQADPKNADTKSLKEAKNVEEFIKKAPKWGADNGPLYRGIGVDEATAKKIISDAQKGKLISQRGTASWSSDQDTANSFAIGSSGGDVPIVFVNKGGTKCGTSIKHLSKFPSENEVLTSEKQRTRATKVRKAKIKGADGYIVEVEEVKP